jgi:hypothetical protein
MGWWEKDKYDNPYDYERQTAKKLGARRSIASGALFGDMDVQGDNVLIDNKRVAKGLSYRIDLRDFKKVADKATVDQIPAMCINFNEQGESLAVVREKDFIALMNQVRELTGNA